MDEHAEEVKKSMQSLTHLMEVRNAAQELRNFVADGKSDFEFSVVELLLSLEDEMKFLKEEVSESNALEAKIEGLAEEKLKLVLENKDLTRKNEKLKVQISSNLALIRKRAELLSKCERAKIQAESKLQKAEAVIKQLKNDLALKIGQFQNLKDCLLGIPNHIPLVCPINSICAEFVHVSGLPILKKLKSNTFCLGDHAFSITCAYDDTDCSVKFMLDCHTGLEGCRKDDSKWPVFLNFSLAILNLSLWHPEKAVFDGNHFFSNSSKSCQESVPVSFSEIEGLKNGWRSREDKMSLHCCVYYVCCPLASN